ncbi:MAG: permease, partial [Actinomycetota bacterium]
MATVAGRPSGRTATRGTAVAILALLALLAVLMRLLDPERVAWVQTFFVFAVCLGTVTTFFVQFKTGRLQLERFGIFESLSFAAFLVVISSSSVIFGSLLIQALPFVLIGALASAAIEVFVPISTLERLAELPRPLQLPAAGLAGIAFPICECGSVPVARRLAAKGLAPSAAVTFMLAAPVVNPVVIASTFVA